MLDSNTSKGELCYRNYASWVNYKSWNNENLKPFKDLPEKIKNAWIHAALGESDKNAECPWD